MSKIAVVYWSGTGHTEAMADAVADGASCESKLKGKRLALFGSYGWGDGEWMRNWEETCIADGANLPCDFVICNEDPDDEAIDACKKLGAAIA